MTTRPATDQPAVPRHVAIIMDGNGRWACRRGLPRLKGHEEGAQSVRAVLRACRDAGVEYLTLYAFSRENWSRPPGEVRGLMKLLSTFLMRHEQELHAQRIRLRLIGHLQDLPPTLCGRLSRIVADTRDYERAQLIVALSYGGRTELADAARTLAAEAVAGKRTVEQINEDSLADCLYAPDVPDPDLLIRTSGEQRLSNFLLWQLSYSELYFTRTLWPDFRKPHFDKALQAYARRQRRYGGVGASC